MANIIFGIYTIVFGLGMKSNIICRRNNVSNDRNHGQGTHSAKMDADSLSENTPKTQNLFGRSAQLAVL